MSQLAAAVLQSCKDRKLTISVAESCTGGLLAAALTEPPGASEVFTLGVVSYSNEAKTELISVDSGTLATYGAVSEQVACQMAAGVRELAESDLSLAITGIAGPGGSEYKPEGRVCFAVAGDTGILKAETIEFGALGRKGVRNAARDHALTLLWDAARR